MSWASSEWKDGLPGRALQKIQEIEQQLEKLKRERQQKQCQMDSLEQTLEKQKRKMEEDRQTNSRTVKENQSLLDTCEELERKRQKVEHDLQTKEAYLSCLEGQLSHTKQAMEAETAKVNSLKLELDRMMSANQTIMFRSEKLAADNAKLQEMSNHHRKQVEDQREQLATLQHNLKHGGMANMSGGGINIIGSRMNSVVSQPAPGEDIANVTKFQQRIVELEALLAKAIDEKQQAAYGHSQYQELTRKEPDGNSLSMASLMQDSASVPSNCANSQSASSVLQGSIGNTSISISDGNNQSGSKAATDSEGLKKLVDSLKQQLQEMEVKLRAADEKAKKVQLEAECHRHNAESIRVNFDQKMKEREKDFRLDLGLAQDALKDCENRLTQSCAGSQKEINKLTAEVELLKSQLDKANHKTRDLEHQLAGQRDRVSSIDGLVSDHQKAVTLLETRIASLNTEKTQQSAKLDDSENQITKKKKVPTATLR